MSTVETREVTVTVTIPITVTYVYNEGDPGDAINPPVPAHIELLSVEADHDTLLAALDEENNAREIHDTTLLDHEQELP